MSRPQITLLPDGPIKVSSADSVRYCGDAVEADGDLYLCRCGQTRSGPFCDGSHRAAGFQSTSEAPPEATLKVWEGRTLQTTFNTAACMHVFHCKPLKELRERELAGDDSAAQELMQVVAACPSGALSFTVKDSSTPVPDPLEPEVVIDIIEGGEIRIQAAFDINTPLQQGQPADRATLCRCGQSRNKPWCDGRHRRLTDFR